ncbi:MAG: AraC family transcriptional regulator [Eubacteriales bacterium]
MYFTDSNEKIIYVRSGDTNGMLDCLLAGVTYPNPEYRMLRHPSTEYVLEYVISGTGHIEYGGDVLDVRAGMFYFIKKGADVVYYADAADPYEKIWINVDGVLVDRLSDLFMLGEVFTEEANVMSLFLEIHDRLEHMASPNSAETYKQISCLLYEMLMEVRKTEFFPDTQDKNALDERIRAYIDANLYSELSLDILSEHFGITKMHIIRVFKRKFGITPMQYLIDKKICVAKSLLCGTVMPIKEIASLLRYSNTQHFSSSFKNATGQTPNKYRQSKHE